MTDGKMLRGLINTTTGGGSEFIAQVTMYSANLGVAITQICYATGENHERADLKTVYGELDIEGVLVQDRVLDGSNLGTFLRELGQSPVELWVIKEKENQGS